MAFSARCPHVRQQPGWCACVLARQQPGWCWCVSVLAHARVIGQVLSCMSAQCKQPQQSSSDQANSA
eukprot:6893269-Alexandrium_andersonii.AAC.1